MMNKKKFSALVLAGTMLLSMGTTVFAADGTSPDVNDRGTVPITKDFEMADGLKTPATTFKFRAESKTPDALKATIANVSYTEGETGTLKDGKYVLTKNTAISFEGQWKHAGEYVYTVTEVEEATGTNVTYDKTTYTVRVYVINGTNGLEIEKITAADGKGDKVGKIVFTNQYTKNDASLTIEKNTEGKQADKTKKFEFTITFTKSPMSEQETFTGKLGDTPVSCTAGQPYTFRLADKEQLVFTGLPVGTTYVVTETGVKGDNYTPSVTVIENNTTTVDKFKGNEADDLSSSNQGKNNLVGENTNKVTFTNTYKDVAITGIVMNNLPFILLVGVAVVAFAALAVMKKRRISER